MNILPWFWSAAARSTDDGYTKATGFLDSNASVKALQWLVDFNAAGLSARRRSAETPDSWGGFERRRLRGAD